MARFKPNVHMCVEVLSESFHLNFRLFGPLKQRLFARHFNTDSNIQLEVHRWLVGLSPDFYCKDVYKLTSQWDKCLNKQVDYIEKYSDLSLDFQVLS
jgi:hypothetical protein